MIYDLTNVSKKVLDKYSCPGITQDKKYLSLDDLIEMYPECVTINGIDKRKSRDHEDFFAFTFKENSEYYFSGGKLFVELANAWIKTCGSIQNINESLIRKPVKVKIGKIRTSSGKPFAKISVVDGPDDENHYPPDDPVKWGDNIY